MTLFTKMDRGNKLGDGTFGIVYAATSSDSEKSMAVKRNIIEKITDGMGSIRELDLLHQLRDYPYIVQLDSVIFGKPFERGMSPLKGADRKKQKDDAVHFVCGQANYDLHSFIYGAKVTNYSLLKRYMIQTLLGLEYMHQRKIIHRDIKPSNILIFGLEKDALGNNNIAKLCDLGLAKPYTNQGIQTPNVMTTWYRAPEVALHVPDYDFRVDVWSSAMVFYEMIAKRSLINIKSDDDDILLSTIIGQLPEALPTKTMRELITLGTYRKVNLKPMANPKVRSPWSEKLGLTTAGIKKFDEQAGSFEQFCHLLGQMCQFDWTLRPTISECIDHPFFDNFKELIAAERQKHSLKISQPVVMKHIHCKERSWVEETVITLFSNRHCLSWYTDRILFQAVNVFDRYMRAIYENGQSEQVESEYTGKFHSEEETILRFLAIVYMCVKYFSSVHTSLSFKEVAEIIPVHLTKKKYVADDEERQTYTDIRNTYQPYVELADQAAQFEASLVINCLQYEIYEKTLYEIADEFDEILDEQDVGDLLSMYLKNIHLNGKTLNEVYVYYRKVAADDIEKMFEKF